MAKELDCQPENGWNGTGHDVLRPKEAAWLETTRLMNEQVKLTLQWSEKGCGHCGSWDESRFDALDKPNRTRYDELPQITRGCIPCKGVLGEFGLEPMFSTGGLKMETLNVRF